MAEYRKMCKCKNATAVTGATVIRFHKMTATWRFIPGPSCNECGKAWKKKKP